MEWAIPFPLPTDDEQPQGTWVWFDALPNYLTATGYPAAGWKGKWPAQLHVVGKDITRFHCVVWPAMLMSAGLPLPTQDMSGDDLFKLGMMYSAESGGCPMDRVSAHMIFNLAAMKGSIEARVYRREMSQEMERDELAEAQRAARRYIDQGVVKLVA